MRYIWQHIETIINTYNGGIPLTHFLRNYFKQNTKLGSRDRKILSEMAYCWYRCSKGFDEDLGFEEKIKACLFLCDTESKHVLQFLPEAWRQAKPAPAKEKMALLASEEIAFGINRLAPFKYELSGGITKEEWLYSMLQQPALFIRVRKNKDRIIHLLDEHLIHYEWLSDNCMGFANGTAIDKILPADSYVVQDASSQLTGGYFKPRHNERWWDCCSGAGGKSLLLKDLDRSIQLTVSDKRNTILNNLKERFKQYGLEQPSSSVLDVADAKSVYNAMQKKSFDNIICDVPCTGAGTWSRTPEQLYYFDPNMIGQISQLQTQIVINASPYLNKGGKLFYITCSVFKEENEGVVNNILLQTDLQLKKMELINGIEQKADSMFITVLEKS